MVGLECANAAGLFCLLFLRKNRAKYLHVPGARAGALLICLGAVPRNAGQARVGDAVPMVLGVALGVQAFGPALLPALLY